MKEISRLSKLFCLVSVLVISSAAFAEESSAVAAAPADPFAEGDAAFKKRGDEQEAWKALRSYRKAYQASPDNPQAGWRVAMACYFVGLRLEKEKKAKLGLFEEGKNAGLKAAELDPQCAPCHFWGAITLALYGETVGVFKMLFAIKDIEKHLNASVGIDPKYAYGGAFRLLGLIEQKLPGILGGDDDEARVWFKKAIETAPDEPLNYLFMAKLLEDKFDDKEGAVGFLEKALKQPVPSEDRLEARESLEEIRKLRDKWGAKKN